MLPPGLISPILTAWPRQCRHSTVLSAVLSSDCFPPSLSFIHFCCRLQLGWVVCVGFFAGCSHAEAWGCSERACSPAAGSLRGRICLFVTSLSSCPKSRACGPQRCSTDRQSACARTEQPGQRMLDEAAGPLALSLGGPAPGAVLGPVLL